jgi:cyclopropane fatty-acyl-phospholipid synthase-like methyltransferase
MAPPRSARANAGIASSSFQDAEAHERLMGRRSHRLAPLLILNDGDRVLDVGCGTGSLTLALVQRDDR